MADEDNLTPGQKSILDELRELGGSITADRYAFLNFGRDIELLSDQELRTIPAFLLDPWLEEKAKEQKDEDENEGEGGENEGEGDESEGEGDESEGDEDEE